MKKSTLLFTIISLFITVSAVAQNDDDWNTKVYEIGEFDKIYLEGGFKVILTQDDECKLVAKSTNDDIFDDLKVRNENGKLIIKMDYEFFRFNRINLYISFNMLEQLEIEGSVNLTTTGYIDLNDFAMSVEGGAKIEMELKAEDIDIVGEGGFLFNLEGIAQNLDVKISGAGHVDAEDLKVQNVDFTVEGVGTGSVYAVNKLNARIEGVGKVRYKGNPRVTQYIDGLGSVRRD